MSSDKRNMLAGPAYERELIKKINAIGVFPTVGRTADHAPELDADKIDLVTIDPELFDAFVYKIQAKSSTRTVPYGKLLSEMKHHKGVPVVFHKQTKRVEHDRFLPTGAFAILEEKDFLKIIGDLERYKKGYKEVICYFDSISDDEKPKLHKRLTDLGL